MAKKLTSTKAREILHDKSVHGHPLTDKQRKFFGAIAGGAKPYKAEDGGWLDRYEQGGLVLKQKTTDNYGKKPNANNSDVSLPPGFKGWAYNTKGRNYSPAWGGQFQDGGGITPYSSNYVNALRNEWVDFYNPIPPMNPPAKDDKFDQFFRFKKEKLPWKSEFKSGWMKQYDDGSSEFREQPKDEPPTRFGKPLTGWSWTDKWEEKSQYGDDELSRLLSNIIINEVRKPESLRDVKFQMGGSLPGAVGFMYARTQSPAPSNGPYAKKTKASAQNGQEMKYYQEGLDFKPKTISQDGRNITTDINDYNRWKDSVKNYIKGQTDLTKSRSAVKKNIDSFSLLKSSDIVGAFTNLIKGDEKGKRRVFPKYSEKAIPKEYWYDNSGTLDGIQQPMSIMTIGDDTYDTHKYIPGITESIDDTAGDYWKRENAAAPYLDIVALYHPPVRKNLQYVKPSKPVPKKPAQPVIVEKEPKLEKPIPIPRDKKDLGLNLPTPGAPSFPKLQQYNPDTPTKYSFTYPTGKYNEQKTMYFPTRSAWKSFTEGVRGASSQEGKNWGSSTGNYQDGGEIAVDPMGYWNPDNWGNPVIIPSNEITMQGVDEPLIGISDTGEVQYMEPGEDYTFDGEYVTEYPVARGGVSVNNADVQSIKKLDQLLNFTNYNKPTKGGWLDKYN